jgi:hypothetical protein
VVRVAALVGFARRATGRAGALMAEAAVRESVTLAGRAERARLARRFVGAVLGPGNPCEDVAVLLVSELSATACGTSGRAPPRGQPRSR